MHGGGHDRAVLYLLKGVHSNHSNKLIKAFNDLRDGVSMYSVSFLLKRESNGIFFIIRSLKYTENGRQNIN